MKKEDQREPEPVLKQGSYIMVINQRECSLDTLRNRNLITEMQYRAGLKYRRLYEISLIGQSTSSFSEKIDSSPRSSIPDSKLHAMQELTKCNSVIGSVSANVMDLVCGEGYGITRLNNVMKWSKYYGGHRLREALGEAAVHFGFKNKGNTIRG